ncbi:uncharacterized protein NMK_0569 [Novimethylophilus kurashikiensis]|uniref:Large ribosomal RNA subunit accumulation protein YceD n=1 Tax=Novimethylophilus kurashikiensis TaxID=1825523 RepID=A0A2R5F8N8_9PROT|nr:YceD family protein [Novimethylophilus kurashikiensis]GBG13031.1 uncharacterized protein NMK_0569 [Novimethylophilus kurashikiensis]
MSTPVLINTLEFVEQSLEIHDKIRASDLPRVQEVLFSGRGDVEYRLVGSRGSRGKFYLQLDLRGTLGLMCQRCLNGLDYPFEIVRRFELVKDESDIPDSDLDDDDVDYLVIEPRLNVTDLVEEEVLLALPMSLRHEDGCSSGDGAPKERKPNPFQVLEGLKTGNKS